MRLRLPLPLAAEVGPVEALICPGPRAILRWTAWFGLLSGTLELAVFLLKCLVLDPRNFNVSRHFPWMYPVAGVLVIGVPGLSLALVATLRPGRISSALVLGVLSSFAYLGILFRVPIFTVVCLLLATALALRTVRFLTPRIDRFDAIVRWSLVGLGGLLALTVAACYGREAWSERRARAALPARPSGARNVLLIVLDTVRAESLSLYGFDRPTTPNLARISKRGVRFDRAFSTAPWTAPSHASMFTGRWARETSVGWNRPLGRSTPTLAGFLAGRGYATAGFVANTTYCSYETGLDRGFIHYEDYDVSVRAILLCSSVVQRALNFAHKHPEIALGAEETESSGPHRKSASRINGDFLRWLDGHRDRPFFAFLNYFDAHHPYLLPDPEGGPAFGRRPGSSADLRMLRDWWDLDKRRLDRRSVELARDSYERCIAYLDDQLGRLFDALDRQGVLNETLVIVTADHGEHLGERRLFGHGGSVYRPELHVPLLVIAPGLVPAGGTVAEPVSLRDLAATVVDCLGIRERSPFPGRSLAASWSIAPGAPLPAAGPVLSEIEAPPDADPNRGDSPACRGPLTSLVDRRFHYIRNGDGREELYDLEGDPREERDLAGLQASAATLQRFRAELPGALAAPNSARPGPLARISAFWYDRDWIWAAISPDSSSDQR